MPTRDHFVVISYDIADNKRRQKVVKALLDSGGERVQLSVFECYIAPAHLERLSRRLAAVMDAQKDSIRFYMLCGSCRGKVNYLGVAQPIDEPGLIII